MGNEIQAKVPQPAVVRPEAVVVPKASNAPASDAAPAPVEIKKPEIKFDAEHARKNLQEALQKLNDMMKDSGRTLSFTMDVKLGPTAKSYVKSPMKSWCAWRMALKTSKACFTTSLLKCIAYAIWLMNETFLKFFQKSTQVKTTNSESLGIRK